MIRFFKTLVILLIGSATLVNAQQIKDGETVKINGMDITFRVVNKEATDVKGVSFDRYKVVATLKNSTDKSFNVRLNKYPDAASITGGKIAELDCINATGAKLTSKKLELQMKTQQVAVTYLTRDKDGKSVNSTITIPVGFYLDPGDTVEESGVFIVPKGEVPQVSVRMLK